MNAVRRASLIALVVVGTACSDVPLPIAPSSIPPPSIPPTSTGNPPMMGTPPAFPSPSRPARVYDAVDQPYYAMHGSPLASRSVLHDDGTFALQYASANYPFFEYRGVYKETDGVVVFDFGSGFGGPRGASGSIAADSLMVNYGEIMQHSDFLDGVYIRAR